jgi:hypothetical protein
MQSKLPNSAKLRFIMSSTRSSSMRNRFRIIECVSLRFYIFSSIWKVRFSSRTGKAMLQIRIRDPLVTPGSWRGFTHIPDLGSLTHNSQGFVTIFWVKSSIILCQLAEMFVCTSSYLNLLSSLVGLPCIIPCSSFRSKTSFLHIMITVPKEQ